MFLETNVILTMKEISSNESWNYLFSIEILNLNEKLFDLRNLIINHECDKWKKYQNKIKYITDTINKKLLYKHLSWWYLWHTLWQMVLISTLSANIFYFRISEHSSAYRTDESLTLVMWKAYTTFARLSSDGILSIRKNILQQTVIGVYNVASRRIYYKDRCIVLDGLYQMRIREMAILYDTKRYTY